MTRGDVNSVIETLRALRPDPVSGTVGEWNLWRRLREDMRNVCRAGFASFNPTDYDARLGSTEREEATRVVD